MEIAYIGELSVHLTLLERAFALMKEIVYGSTATVPPTCCFYP
jgi:hypothetical protein